MSALEKDFYVVWIPYHKMFEVARKKWLHKQSVISN